MTVRKTFISDGHQLSYIDEGEGEPVVLVHGFASNVNTNWIVPGWVKFLNKHHFRVLAFDNRGHGESEKLYQLEEYGSHLMARDVKALIEHAGLTSAHLMGYSMGARICAFTVLEFPEIARSLIIAGMGFHLVRGIGNPEPIARALEAPNLEDVINPAARSFRVFAEQTGSDLKALAACMRSSRKPISKDALSTISIPTLVAVGTEDVIAGSGPKLAEIIPPATALDIPGRDHMKAVGDKVYKEGVRAFLSEHKEG